MKVCLDIQAAVAQRAGVGRYTQQLVRHLPRYAGSDDLSAFYFDFRRRGAAELTGSLPVRSVRWVPGRWVQRSWRALNAPAFDLFSGPADVFHFPNFIIPPLRRGRTVVTIHDVSFLRHPEATEARNLQYLTKRIRQTVAKADAIITDSHFSACEIEDLLGVPEDRVFPIHLGLSELAAPEEEQILKARKDLNLDKPYILTVGTLEPRKNHTMLIEAFERLNDFDGDLVIAGMRGWKYEPILERMQNSPCASRIRYLDYVPEEHLAALYGGAELFVFPSLYEGFGLPPLEAMACGTPVVSSSEGSLKEVLGSAVEYMDELTPEACATSMQKLLQDEGRCESLSVWGFKQAATFSWAETAYKTWEVYRSV